MAQVTFTADTTPSLADLDANFTELYALRNLFTVSGSNAGLGATPSYKLDVLASGTAATDVDVVRVQTSATSTAGAKLLFGTAANLTQVAHITGRSATGSTGTLRLGSSGSDRFVVGDASFTPAVDNSYSLGSASFRASVVYAGTGTINTSDEREKDSVRSMSAAEMAAASDVAKEIGAFRFLDAIQSKGDDARIHIGLTVQRVMQIMQGHGLDPLRYGFICYDEWPERLEPARYADHESLLDESGLPMRVLVEPAKLVPAGNRYGFRPEELLFFVARGLEARLAALEAA